jgi:hypothetical protein
MSSEHGMPLFAHFEQSLGFRFTLSGGRPHFVPSTPTLLNFWDREIPVTWELVHLIPLPHQSDLTM